MDPFNFSDDGEEDNSSSSIQYLDTTNKNSDQVKTYRVLNNIAHGRYGDVVKCELMINNNNENKDDDDNNIYALKIIETFGQSLNKMIKREIKLMKQVRNDKNASKNVIKMVNHFENQQRLLFVLPFFDQSLDIILKNEAPFDQLFIKNIMNQIFDGLSYLHSINIIHRDIKPNNILYNTSSLHLVIADLGSARDITDILEEDKENEIIKETTDNKENNDNPSFDDPEWRGFENGLDPKLTPQIYVVQYRAPELVLGERNYRFGVDIWASGCIMAQMLNKNGSMLFTKDHDIPLFLEQISILGGPKHGELDNVGLFSSFFEMESRDYNPIKDIFGDNKPSLNEKGLDLLSKLLTLGPSQRITAKQALSHEFFNDNHDDNTKDTK